MSEEGIREIFVLRGCGSITHYFRGARLTDILPAAWENMIRCVGLTESWYLDALAEISVLAELLREAP